MSDDASNDYESGPFCPHWAEAGECDILCATCGHRCTSHALDGGECFAGDNVDCTCKKFRDPPTAERPGI